MRTCGLREDPEGESGAGATERAGGDGVGGEGQEKASVGKKRKAFLLLASSFLTAPRAWL